MSVCEKCLEKIKYEKIKPTARSWHDISQLALKLLVSVLIFASVILVSITLISVSEIDFDAYSYMNIGFGEFLISVIPYFSILLLAFTCFLAIKLFRATEFGYRAESSKILFIGSTVILFGTTAVFITNLASTLNEAIEAQTELSQVFKSHKYQVWTNPEKGLLAGKVEKITDFDLLEVRDFNSKLWLINTSRIFKFPELKSGNHYKFLGSLDIESYIFFAAEARPWYK